MKAAYDMPQFTINGFFNSLPLIIFSYMYQPNIPALYSELKKREIKNMQKVLGLGTLLASCVYIVCGIFGFATFALNTKCCDIMEGQNILKGDYGDNKIIRVCLFGVLFVVLFASPFCVLPCKDGIEELMISDKNKKFTPKQNFIVTFVIILVAYIIAIVVPSIGDAMSILGATTNTGVGFLLPIIFYNRIESRNGSKFSNDKVFSYIVFIFICCCSVAEIYSFVDKKINNSASCE